jgi:hypothetical protein
LCIVSVRKLGLFALICSVAGSLERAAYADLITTLTVSTSQNQDGSTHYEYDLANAPQSTLPVAEFLLTIGSNAALTNIQGPANWDLDYYQGSVAVAWGASDIPYLVPPGTDVMFGFDSVLQPALNAYSVTGLDASGDFGVNSGSIESPGVAFAAVPEPTSMIPLGIGMATLAAYTSYRRRSSDDH